MRTDRLRNELGVVVGNCRVECLVEHLEIFVGGNGTTGHSAAAQLGNMSLSSLNDCLNVLSVSAYCLPSGLILEDVDYIVDSPLNPV